MDDVTCMDEDMVGISFSGETEGFTPMGMQRVGFIELKRTCNEICLLNKESIRTVPLRTEI